MSLPRGKNSAFRGPLDLFTATSAFPESQPAYSLNSRIANLHNHVSQILKINLPIYPMALFLWRIWQAQTPPPQLKQGRNTGGLCKTLRNVVSRAGKQSWLQNLKMSRPCTSLLDLTHLVIPWPLGQTTQWVRVQVVVMLVGLWRLVLLGRICGKEKILLNGTAWVTQALGRDLNIM